MRLPRPRFTLRRMMAAIALVAVLVACCLWTLRPPADRLELAPSPDRANTDHDLFDILLTDLIENPEFSTATLGDGLKKTEIVLGLITMRGYTRGDRNLDSWAREQEVEPDVVSDLIDRNPEGRRCSLALYRPSNPNILVRDIDQIDYGIDFRAPFPKGRGYVKTHLPGYSRDGQTALIRFWFGPTAHGAQGYYLLKKARGRWEIVGRSFWYSE